jgi:hypothetical protein
MRFEFRIGLTVGLAATLAIGLYCLWLWNAERQVARHTENLFHKIEQKKWSAVADFVADDYVDQWKQDRALILERMRLVLGYAHHFQINVTDVDCKIDNNGLGVWRGKITIDGDDAELMTVVKQHLNSLTEPFELRWRHLSGKPWDWKLVRVSNAELEIPAGFE